LSVNLEFLGGVVVKGLENN